MSILSTERKKQVVRDLFEDGWSRLQFDSFSEFIGEKVLFNFRGAEQVTNLGELKSLVAFWKSAFPDLSFQILAILVEDELAAANLRFTGTHQGEWQGIQPSGQRIMVEEMMFFRFEDGKIVELWEVYDESTMLNQISQEAAGEGEVE